MARKHELEELIGKLCEAEIVLAQGGSVADPCRRISVTDQSYCRCARNMAALRWIRRHG